MVTLCIWVVILPATMLLTAWAMARSARAVGSPRGQLRYGCLAFFYVLIVNIVFIILGSRAAAPADLRQALLRQLMLLLLQLFVIFVVLRRTFRLSPGRAFAPFGALILVTLLQLALALMVLRPWVTEAFVIRSASMSPTLDDRDRVAVDKLIPLQRWDLVAYRSEPDRAIYCKRLVALPGERLRFDGGGIYINDQSVSVPAVLAGRCHATLPIAAAMTLYRDGQTIALGPDEYFFIGDNIDVSADSRIYGPATRSTMVGVIDMIYWPPRKFRIVR